jgi:hypothetical protein
MNDFFFTGITKGNWCFGEVHTLPLMLAPHQFINSGGIFYFANIAA